jgi:hypothetical protein
MGELPNSPPVAELVEDVTKLIVETRRQTVAAINFGLLLFTGGLARESREVLGRERGAYGKQIVGTLSRQLSWFHFSALPPLSHHSYIRST